MRVYELAEELDVSSNEIIDLLEDEFDLDVGNHMSGLEDETVSLLREYYSENGDGASADASQDSSGDEATASDDEMDSESADSESQEIQSNVDDVQPGDTPEPDVEDRPDDETLVVEGVITTEELADKLDVPANEAIKKLMDLGVMATINQSLEEDAVELLCDEYGYDVEFKEAEDEGVFDQGVELDVDDAPEEDLQERPAVLTVMGHVDHGKTQLLDTIRKTDVHSQESGGITQHIGAYRVQTGDHDVVFIDTPGHEAFTAMRARGANVTDIVVLVVAADDGVQPQTVESINHAREADVPIIVAINKMDKPEADADRVRQQLSEHELIPEEWGGDTIMVELSALEGSNIDELLEMIDIQSEIMDLRTSPNLPVKGTVIEAEMQQGMGPTATVLVQQGTLKKGQPFLAGSTWGSVRALIDSRGERVDEIAPGSPVEILGFEDLPQPGDGFKVTETESEAREIAEERQDELKAAQQQDQRKVSLSQLQEFIEQEKVKTLNIVIKADTRGSIEVLEDSFQSLDAEAVETRVIHTGVGGVNESDIMLAEASDGIVIGFNVRPGARARELAKEKGVEIKTYSVIYEAIQDVRRAMEGMLEPDIEEQTIGQAEIREVFSIPGAGNIAGCYVENGEIRRNANARVVRDGVLVHDGEITSLRRFKEDVTDVQEGYECGIGVGDFNDIKEGDIIEAYVEEEVEATLA
ncbi:MAG: translation initiation factor IF-2 [bacterium]